MSITSPVKDARASREKSGFAAFREQFIDWMAVSPVGATFAPAGRGFDYGPAPLPSRYIPIPSSDRLGVSTFASFLIHMLIILGVTFAVPKLRELSGAPTLEITLVQAQSETPPDDPEFLAQVNQDGGGDVETSAIARNPFPLKEISEETHQIPATHSLPQPRVASPREVAETMNQRSETKVQPVTPKPEPKDLQAEPFDPGLLASTEFNNERAHLNAEISRFWQEHQKQPKHKYLNARTREYKYAAYMDAWRAKVERIGNLNYPEEARRRFVSGNLVLDVALNSDGTIYNVSVRRSSGHRLLDDAAVRIVELAAPFAPFPPEIRAESDVIHITRTWKFNETLSSN
jgi:protein TonB